MKNSETKKRKKKKGRKTHYRCKLARTPSQCNIAKNKENQD